MKPFNLDAALKGEPVCTRDGRPVKIAGYNPEITDAENIVAWIDKRVFTWFANGKYSTNDDNVFDLFMAEKPKVKREGWVRLLFDVKVGYYINSRVYDNEDDVKTNSIAAIKIEWEEESP